MYVYPKLKVEISMSYIQTLKSTYVQCMYVYPKLKVKISMIYIKMVVYIHRISDCTLSVVSNESSFMIKVNGN